MKKKRREWLKDYRKKSNLLVREIANELHISVASYWYFESGERTPRPKLAKKLGKLLKFDWEMFYMNE